MKTASAEKPLVRIFRITYSVIVGFFWYYSPLNKFRNLKFYSDKEVVDMFLNGCSISRFGDGELRIISNTPSSFYQENNKELGERLLAVAKRNDKNAIICFPKPLSDLKDMTLKAKLFWISNAFWNRKEWAKCIEIGRCYGDTQITRPYMDRKDKKLAHSRYDNLKRAWNNKNICIIEGKKTHLGEGNDLFKNARSIKRIIGPKENAYNDFETILKKALRVEKDYIFLIALGPTATVLSNELSKHGRIAFDIGHVDIEYEWMKRGAKRKEAISGKAVNEARQGRG